MKITHLPTDSNPAGWERLLEPATAPVLLEGKQTADWLIIGGGYAGLAAAQRLKQLHPGDRIAVVEARRIGQGPAGRNSGFMIDLPHNLSSNSYEGSADNDRAEIRANRAGIDFAAEMAAEYRLSHEAFSPAGKVNGAATEKGCQHIQDYVRHLKQLGEPHEMLDATQMQAMTGLDYYQAGLFTPGTAIIQPAMFVRNVATGLITSGIKVFEASPVFRLIRDQDWVASTPQGQITAPKVILAVNGHINSFGHFQKRLMHVFTYASMTRSLTPDEVKKLGGQSTWGLTPADPMGTTVRRISGTGGDRIIIRNRFTYNPSMEVDEKNLDHIWLGHHRSFRARFKKLLGVEMEYQWGGRLCLSRNSVPALGQIDERLYSACCQNGLGTAKGTLHGKLMAELASGHKSDLLDEIMALPKPRRLPPALLTSIAARFLIRKKEISASHEL